MVQPPRIGIPGANSADNLETKYRAFWNPVNVHASRPNSSINPLLNQARVQARFHEFVDPLRYNWVPTPQELLENDSRKGFLAQLVPRGNPAQSYFITGGFESGVIPRYWIYDHRVGYLHTNVTGEVFAMYTGLRREFINYRFYNDPRLRDGCHVRLWSLTGMP